MKKAKWSSEEALQIPENKGKQKAKERCTNLNADLQEHQGVIRKHFKVNNAKK